ncbi:MAG: response regulator [Gammaproteobacteria bacterium]|nr:response regulator [Gammaproteobacteria bacterium]
MKDKPKILIIDDENLYLDVLIAILHPEYRILVAKSGEAGLARLRGDNPADLVLLDVMMPGIDGYETCRRIKADPAIQQIPVIFLTSRDDIEGETFGLSLGAVDYIAKPISPPIVKARIHTHLELRSAQRALQRQNLHLEERVRERTDSLRRLSAELVLAEERERRRIAQELHDGPAQRLVLSKMNLGRLRSGIADTDKQTLDDAWSAIDTTLKELRTLMVQLSPPALYELGLGPAVEWLAESILGKQGIEFRVDTAEAYNRLNEETRVFLFQAIRELMINIVKHARAGRASVAINSNDSELLIEVRDDGVGIGNTELDAERLEDGGFGLFALRDRIDMLGGSLLIDGAAGMHVTLRVPVTARELNA